MFLLAFPRIGFKHCLQAKGVNEERERERKKKLNKKKDVRSNEPGSPGRQNRVGSIVIIEECVLYQRCEKEQ